MSEQPAIPPEKKIEPDAKAEAAPAQKPLPKKPVAEIGGPAGPEPTRYGDWERNGRCIDF
jgi:hypothetical protein